MTTLSTPTYAGHCDIKIVHNNGYGVHDITKLVESVAWSGDVKQAYRALDVSLINTTYDKDTRLVGIRLGGEVRFYNYGVELFRGRVFADDIDNVGRHSFTAYDSNVYLVKNTDARKFTKVTATAIIKRLCADFGIPTGTIEDTGYVIPKMYFKEGDTLWDMMISALTETEKKAGKRFFITNNLGKLEVRRRSKQVSQWIIENGVNLLDASYSRSIEDLRTQVKVVGGDDKKEFTATERDADLMKEFGKIQHFERMSGKDVTSSQVRQKAKELLKQLGTINDTGVINAHGIDTVISTTSVYVKEEMTRMVGGYYVASDSHVFKGGKHSMSLTLSATDDLPRLEYEHKEDKEEKKKKKKKGAKKKK